MASHSDSPPSIAESTVSINGAGNQSASASTGGRYTTNSTLRPVVTEPPWAKDEPESPTFDSLSAERSPRPSGAASTTRVPSVVSDRPSSSTENVGGHHRWKFALPRPRTPIKPSRRQSSDSSLESSRDGRSPYDGRSRPPRPRWPNSRKYTSPETIPTPHHADTFSSSRPSRTETLRLQLPLPQPRAPFTISHSKTPGWNSPWTPRVPDSVYTNDRNNSPGRHDDVGPSRVWTNNHGRPLNTKEAEQIETGGLDYWGGAKKKIRIFLLNNSYIPLVSRLVNLAFTTITLALAIRIRLIEKDHHLRGAVGSSPVLAVIFAPLTLVHTMIAIYLEYFGRPLGLWRTSAKLAHTLSEVLFICAWSAELSLCFDNYFTSPLHCAPPAAVRWYSDLPPFSSPIGDNATGDLLEDGRALCSYQLDLIGVVMVALLLYCTNLVISLFRIFEKVKVHQGWDRVR